MSAIDPMSSGCEVSGPACASVVPMASIDVVPVMPYSSAKP